MRRIKRIYGWSEQNEAAYGIAVKDVPDDVEIQSVDIDEETGLITTVHGMPDGEWFTKFQQAKKAAILHWQQQRNIARQALEKIKKTKLVFGIPRCE